MVLPPSLQSSLPASWLAFTGRELNPLDCYKRFQITFPSSFSGFVLAQGKFHGVASLVFAMSRAIERGHAMRTDGENERLPDFELRFQLGGQ
jgi:hypothetical protein